MIESCHPETHIKESSEHSDMEIDDDIIDQMINNSYSCRDNHNDESDDEDNCNDHLVRLPHTGGVSNGMKVRTKIKFNFQKIGRSKRERAMKSFIHVIGNPRSYHGTVHGRNTQSLSQFGNAHTTIHEGPIHEHDDRSRDTARGQQ